MLSKIWARCSGCQSSGQSICQGSKVIRRSSSGGRTQISKMRCGTLMLCTVLGLAVWGSRSTAAEPPRPFPPNTYRVAAYLVHDGDTLTDATVLFDFNAALVDQSIRFHDFDAWEVTAVRQTVDVTASEKIKGAKARDELIALLKTGTVWICPSGDGHSVYGRLEADIWLVKPTGEKVDVAKWMRAHGHERK